MNNELSYEELLHLAAYSVNNGDLATALNLCKKVNVNEVPDQRLNLIHAAILNQLGLHKESIEIYKLVVHSAPDNELARFQLGVAYFFSDDIENAEVYWEQLDYFVHFAEGLISAKAGKFEEAIKHLSLFIANNDEYPALNSDADTLLKAFTEKLEKENAADLATNDSDEVRGGRPIHDDIGTEGEKKTSHANVAALLSIYKE